MKYVKILSSGMSICLYYNMHNNRQSYTLRDVANTMLHLYNNDEY